MNHDNFNLGDATERLLLDLQGARTAGDAKFIVGGYLCAAREKLGAMLDAKEAVKAADPKNRIFDLLKQLADTHPAFPTAVGLETIAVVQGLSKRELFAALAMVGHLASLGPGTIDKGSAEAMSESWTNCGRALASALAREEKK